MKLNLGCGHRHLPGFVNVDLPDNWSKLRPDVEADITKPLPFEDGVADEVHAYHVLEHIWHWQVYDVLQDWCRVLKPGGKLVLEMPCLDKVLHLMLYAMQAQQPIEPRLSMWALYGDPRYKSEAMTHKWCYGQMELTGLLEALGLSDIKILEPQTHIAVRDMRAEAIKGEPA